MTYIKEAHGGVFRRVALSGLLDSANRPHRKEPDTQTTRIIRHIHQSDVDEQQDLGAGSCYVMDERGSRKLLFKKRSTSSTCASTGFVVNMAEQTPRYSYDGRDSPIEGGLIRQASLHPSLSKNVIKTPGSQVGQTIQKAKKRMEDQFTKFGFGKGKKKDGSMEETQGSCEYDNYYDIEINVLLLS
uniref:(California timema) hypothetical protein n=1 Tax=Timema californicum TaxID=61474 RepID=A0A7R9J775_TIMCA|nr:unnamed protein product [Timema californicum]